MGDPLFMATEWLKIVTIVAFSLPAFFLFIKYRRDSKIVGKLICFLTLLYIIATSIMGLATAALGFFMIYDSGIDSYYSFGVLGVLPIAFLTLIIAQKFNKRFSAFLHRRLVSNKTIIIQYNFTKINDDHTAELTFSVFNPSRPTQSQDDIRCYEYEYDKAPDKCIRKIRGNISLRDLGLRQQYTDAGKNMLLRNLNTNSVIKNSNGSEIIGEGIYPSQLKLLKWSDSKDIFSF